jgi:hypothetical protein
MQQMVRWSTAPALICWEVARPAVLGVAPPTFASVLMVAGHWAGQLLASVEVDLEERSQQRTAASSQLRTETACPAWCQLTGLQQAEGRPLLQVLGWWERLTAVAECQQACQRALEVKTWVGLARAALATRPAYKRVLLRRVTCQTRAMHVAIDRNHTHYNHNSPEKRDSHDAAIAKREQCHSLGGLSTEGKNARAPT